MSLPFLLGLVTVAVSHMHLLYEPVGWFVSANCYFSGVGV